MDGIAELAMLQYNIALIVIRTHIVQPARLGIIIYIRNVNLVGLQSVFVLIVLLYQIV